MTATHMYSVCYKGWAPNSGPLINACQTNEALHPYGAEKPSTWIEPKSWLHAGLLFSTRQLKTGEVFYCPSSVDTRYSPRDWAVTSAQANPVSQIRISYLYTFNHQVDKIDKKVGDNSYTPLAMPLARLKITTAMFADAFVNGGANLSFNWPHRGGVNAGYVDGSCQLTTVPAKVVSLARFISNQPDGPQRNEDRDFFAFCFFRMLSNDRIWMESNSFKPPAMKLPSPLPATPYR
jgi:prepilin-type processing-associated H-X9-DG protein